MLSELPLLSLVIWFPILGGIAVLFIGDENPVRAKALSLTVAILSFLISIPLFSHFDATTAAMQFQEFVPWIPAFNVNYHLGARGGARERNFR